MDDLISRQAAIDAVLREGRNVDSRYVESERIIHESDAVEALALLPSAQDWIPCSERLPSEGEYVLVTEKWHGYVWMWRLQSIDNEPTWEVDGMDWYNADIDEAVAWMPLPEPWKGADDETD